MHDKMRQCNLFRFGLIWTPVVFALWRTYNLFVFVMRNSANLFVFVTRKTAKSFAETGFVLRTAFLIKNIIFVISDPGQYTGLAEI